MTAGLSWWRPQGEVEALTRELERARVQASRAREGLESKRRAVEAERAALDEVAPPGPARTT